MELSRSDDRDQRLSRISTLWTMVRQTHGTVPDARAAAHERLLQRYQGAVHAYLLGAVRRGDVADQLFQEFALRVVRGDFSRAKPEKGRFRDYLRSSLIHLVTDYHRERNAWPRRLSANSPQPTALSADDSTPDFAQHWREEMLERTWGALAEAQPTYHAVLLFRVHNPDVPSPRMAEELALQLGKPLAADAVRKNLQRAHAKFAELLLDEVAASLAEPTLEELENELRELDLLRYCRPALENRKAHDRGTNN